MAGLLKLWLCQTTRTRAEKYSNRIKDFGSLKQKFLNGYYIAILIKVMKRNHRDV